MLEWHEIKSRKDLPKIGTSVIYVRDLGGCIDHICGEWTDIDDKYYSLNSVIAWAEFNPYKGVVYGAFRD